MPAVEIAARPWLYPRASFGDTDIKARLYTIGRIQETNKPSIKTSWLRKISSRCGQQYQADFPLQCLLFDVMMAKQLTLIVAKAEEQKISPDEASSGMQCYAEYWNRESMKLEDMCRRHGRKPNLFFTVAPAEWTFPIHETILRDYKDAGKLSDTQAALTLHMYHVLIELIETDLLKKGVRDASSTGIKEILDYSIHIEYQGRGTLHIHVVAWVVFDADGAEQVLSGRSGEKSSVLVRYLEKTFRASVDVQCDELSCTHFLVIIVQTLASIRFVVCTWPFHTNINRRMCVCQCASYIIRTALNH